MLCHVTGVQFDRKLCPYKSAILDFLQKLPFAFAQNVLGRANFALINPPFCGDNFLTDTSPHSLSIISMLSIYSVPWWRQSLPSSLHTQLRPLFVWMLAMLRNTYDGSHGTWSSQFDFKEDSVRQFGFIRDKNIHEKNNYIMSLLACGSIHQGHERFNSQSRGKQCSIRSLFEWNTGIACAPVNL